MLWSAVCPCKCLGLTESVSWLASRCARSRECCSVQFAYAVSPVKLLAKDDPLYSWRQRMLKAYDNPQTAHGQKGYPESLE